MKDYYKVLGVPRTASADEIKRAYRERIRGAHPDYHPDDKELEEKSKELNEAYAVLGDEDKKKEYDFKLRQYSSYTQSTTKTPKEEPTYTVNSSDLLFSFFGQDLRYPESVFNLGLNLEEEFDKFIAYLEEKETEALAYGLSTKDYRERIKHRRGTMTVREIQEAKRQLENTINDRKLKAKKFDQFNQEYNSLKEELEKQGEVLQGDFSKYLDSKNRCKLDETEINSASLEMRSNYYEAKRKINNRMNDYVKQFNKYGLSAIMFLSSRNVLVLDKVLKEDMECLESLLNLINQIDAKMKLLKSSARELLSKLRINSSNITVELLTLINKNIDFELIKGMFAKHRIMNMNINFQGEDSKKSQAHKK